jgi:hypothetical protein
MRKMIVSLSLGLIAGIIDIIPMILQRLDWYSNMSAFTQWIVLGIIINYIDFDLKGWLKGLIVAELAAIPIMILVSETDGFSIIPIVVMSAILGSFVGFMGDKYAK